MQQSIETAFQPDKLYDIRNHIILYYQVGLSNGRKGFTDPVNKMTFVDKRKLNEKQEQDPHSCCD